MTKAMNTAVRFTFDTDFEGPISEGAPARPEPRSRKSYSSDEIEAMRETAYCQGHQSGDVRASEALAAAVAQIAASAIAAARVLDAEIENIRAEAAQLAFACARKLAGAALAFVPEAEIMETLRAALHHALAETHVTVKTAPGLASILHVKAEEVVAQEGYEGRVRFVSDPDLGIADCRIEWRGGGIERKLSQIEDSLAGIIARRFPPHNKE